MISVQDVLYIANLAKIHLSEDESVPLARDLESILHYIQQLEGLDVSEVKPTSHVLPLQNVYRPDEIQPSLPQDKALSVAVSQWQGFFKVPKIIESHHET